MKLTHHADTRFVVGGIAHARSGQLGQHRVERRAGFRSQVPADRAHAVDVLLTDGDAAAFGTVDVAEVAVGVQAVGQLGQRICSRLSSTASRSGVVRTSNVRSRARF